MLADPTASFGLRRDEIDRLRDRARRAISRPAGPRDGTAVRHSLDRIRAVSPQATLERGYAILVGSAGQPVRSVTAVGGGGRVVAHLADGQLVVAGPRGPTPRRAMTEPPANPPISYEQARDELVALVQRLETGGAPLDESLALWERGEQLAAICQAWLDGAKAQVEAARAADPHRRSDAQT